jgi:predicted dehydrogenase
MLRAAVVGAGMMGRHHVRILSHTAGVELAYVVDADHERAAALAAPAGAAPVASIDEVTGVDIAVVAVPTEQHHAIGMRLLAEGVSVMMEKPLALTEAEGAELVEAARSAGVTLAVGHVERFNPVVRFLRSLPMQPRHIAFERMSPFTPRITSNVISDLMVHDLDLACEFCGGEPVRVEAVAVPVFTEMPDIASALLEFESGAIVTLSASRATQDKVRRIAISEADRYIVADCLRQDLQIKRETTVEFADNEPNLYRQANVVEIPYLDRSGEPLALEIADFVEAVREKRAPTVTGEDGLRAVRLAAAVERAAGFGG